MLDVMDDLLVAGYETTERSERFTKGGHDQIHLIGQTEVRGRTAATAHHTQTMGIVHHKARAVFLAKRGDLRQKSQVAAHAVEAIHHDKSSLIGRNTRQDAFQIGHIVVAETASLTQSQTRSVHQAGMIFLVKKDHIAAHNHGADHPQVGLHAGGKNEGGFLANPFGQLMFQLLMQLQRAIEEARAGTRSAKLLNRIDGGLPDARVSG